MDVTELGLPSKRSGAVSWTAYGVDGCRAGWFYFALTDSRRGDWGLVQTINELVSNAGYSDRIFVDIPIGLPDGPKGRRCDAEARKMLKAPRAASVFSAPTREALDAATYDEAGQISRETTGKGMTKQTFAILAKIREVDGLLQGNKMAQQIVREIHPEICFWALSGYNPMRESKKTHKGFNDRRALLKRYYPPVRDDFAQIRAEFRCWDLADDDILDAMVACVTASVPQRGLRTLPIDPEEDATGLPMRMVYADERAFRELVEAHGPEHQE